MIGQETEYPTHVYITIQQTSRRSSGMWPLHITGGNSKSKSKMSPRWTHQELAYENRCRSIC